MYILCNYRKEFSVKISSVIDISNCSKQKLIRQKIKQLAVDYRTSTSSPWIMYVTLSATAYDIIKNFDENLIISAKK